MPDFNVDKNKFFPNQGNDKAYTECTGYTISDIVGNFYSTKLDPDFAYAAGFAISGTTPSELGEDPWNVMLGAVAYGSLPQVNADWTTAEKGELFTANYNNYSADDKAIALKYTMNGAYKVDVTFDAVLKAINDQRLGVALGMKWCGAYDQNAVFTIAPTEAPFSLHCVAAYGQKTINGEPCLIIKPWCGTIGDGGYLYMNRTAFARYVVSACAFNQQAYRWASLIGIAITRFPYLVSYIPQLIKAQGFPPSTYNIAKACLGDHLTLDPTVPKEYGCAEAISYILLHAGVVGIPDKGFAGTPDLYNFLRNSTQFTEISAPTTGAIVISPTIGSVHGHCGCVLLRGIASNDSATGKFSENYAIGSWEGIFAKRGLSTHYFAPKC